MVLQFNSDIKDIISKNGSFDACKIQICYPGKNRNMSRISKEAIEAALPSLKNCPVVCNYDIEDDTIGGHDVDFVTTKDGDLKMVNLTDPVGVIPGDANFYWEKHDDNGVTHEYLCADAILWKRSAAYDKIKSDGVTSQSMEITVADGGKAKDGYYDINKFEFTALCLLGEGIEPCFESADAEMFSLDKFGSRMSEMMEDFKLEFSKVTTADADDIQTDSYSKGGNGKMDIKDLMLKYNISEEDIDFAIEGMDAEEIERNFARIQEQKIAAEEPVEQEKFENSEEVKPEPEVVEETEKPAEEFSLTGEQFVEQVNKELHKITYTDDLWGECRRYWFEDYSMDDSEIYVYDTMKAAIYGIPYSMNGDNVVLDVPAAKHKKIVYENFDEGEQELSVFNVDDDSFRAAYNKMQDALNEKIDKLSKENEAYAAKERSEQENELFGSFDSSLGNDEHYEALKANCKDMSIAEIEEKCYAILGRKHAKEKESFALEQGKADHAIRLPIEDTTASVDDEPYGGAFIKYGSGKK